MFRDKIDKDLNPVKSGTLNDGLEPIAANLLQRGERQLSQCLTGNLQIYSASECQAC